MARIISLTFLFWAFLVAQLAAQHDTIPDPRLKKASPAPARKADDHSKVLLDTSFNPGTKKGDSLSRKRQSHPVILKRNEKKSDKTVTPRMKTRDTTYRAK